MGVISVCLFVVRAVPVKLDALLTKMNENDHCKIKHIASAYYKEIQSWG